MAPEPLRVYADTSVFGGAFDPEFEAASRRFLARVRRGELHLVVSPLVRNEIDGAPRDVRSLFGALVPFGEMVEVPPAAEELQAAYVRHGVVSQRWAPDALHVAIATVTGCAAIVSWNSRHVVNLRRIPLYNAVNALEGYAPIAIYTPMEVLEDEEEAL